MLSKTFQTNPRRDEISKESKNVNERLDRSNMNTRTEQGENKPRIEYRAMSHNTRRVDTGWETEISHYSSTSSPVETKSGRKLQIKVIIRVTSSSYLIKISLVITKLS